jgi:hypothetical protein
MPLRIIGAGLPRTGTISLKIALETLGFGRCYHMSELLQNMPHVPLWVKAYDDKAFDWETIFSQYGATTDMPACAFYRELAAHYPEAKVILTVREPVSWFESFTSTMGSAEFQDAARQASSMTADIALLIGKISARVPWGAGRFGKRDEMTRGFAEHSRAVAENIAPERLLVYDVAQGWPPLCEFLGCSVPDVAFPYLNTREEFLSGIAGRKESA